MATLDRVPPAALVGVGERLVALAGAGLGIVATFVLGGLLANATYQFGRIARSILRGELVV